MPRVGFEPMILVFKRPKTVRDLDRAATGTNNFDAPKIIDLYLFRFYFVI
jgi:hypothetical protein